MYKILICDDERDIRNALRIYLTGEGYAVCEADSGLAALELMQREEVQLVLMDIMMPGMDGMTATAKLREQSNVPVILITAKSEDSDKILGLSMGADDYVSKPYNPQELVARVRSQLRRYTSLGDIHSSGENTIVNGRLTFNLDEHVLYADGEPVKLTATETKIVELLMRNPNRVYSRENLLDLIWGYEYRSDIRTVDVHIRRIREKLETVPAEPEYIMTKWGVGYYFKA